MEKTIDVKFEVVYEKPYKDKYKIIKHSYSKLLGFDFRIMKKTWYGWKLLKLEPATTIFPSPISFETLEEAETYIDNLTFEKIIKK
jgi:hypothetical protein